MTDKTNNDSDHGRGGAGGPAVDPIATQFATMAAETQRHALEHRATERQSILDKLHGDGKG